MSGLEGNRGLSVSRVKKKISCNSELHLLFLICTFALISCKKMADDILITCIFC